MFVIWLFSNHLLPQGIFRPLFLRLFSARVRDSSFWPVLFANLLPFFGLQFMNLFQVNRSPGGLLILPIFWVILGLLYGTNSFVFAAEPIPFSSSVLWTRSGFNELLAYAFAFEASRPWAVWRQDGLFHSPRSNENRAQPTIEDFVYWIIGLVLLTIAVFREVW
jgi:hypothetical protein